MNYIYILCNISPEKTLRMKVNYLQQPRVRHDWSNLAAASAAAAEYSLMAFWSQYCQSATSFASESYSVHSSMSNFFPFYIVFDTLQNSAILITAASCCDTAMVLQRWAQDDD